MQKRPGTKVKTSYTKRKLLHKMYPISEQFLQLKHLIGTKYVPISNIVTILGTSQLLHSKSRLTCSKLEKNC